MNNRLILAIETSSTICGVAIIKGYDCLALIERETPRKHAEILPSFIENTIAESGYEINKIDAIAVSIGPGSFTGLRIGLGFAKGFAFAHNLPIIAVPTIEAMVFSQIKHKPEICLLLSHGNNIFSQQFFWKNQLPNSVSRPNVNKINNLMDSLDRKSTILQWNCNELLPIDLKFLTVAPSAKSVGTLGNIKYDQLVIKKPYELEPDYIAPFKILSKK